MTKKAKKKSSKASSTPEERRQNLALREVVNELVDHVRWISQNLRGLSPMEIEHAQDRLEWLADEVWRLTIDGD